jgi:hypothetical protein
MSKSSVIQAHTDKYSLVGALDPDTGEIKPVNLGDGTVLGLAVQQWVWNTVTGKWEKAIQPEFSLTGEVKVDNEELEQLISDQLEDYKFSGYSIDGDNIYTGYERKDAAYYVTYYNLATGVITYAVGTGGIVAPGSYSGLSYGSFASKF